jgi:hypothetical protein
MLQAAWGSTALRLLLLLMLLLTSPRWAAMHPLLAKPP